MTAFAVVRRKGMFLLWITIKRQAARQPSSLDCRSGRRPLSLLSLSLCVCPAKAAVASSSLTPKSSLHRGRVRVRKRETEGLGGRERERERAKAEELIRLSLLSFPLSRERKGGHGRILPWALCRKKPITHLKTLSFFSSAFFCAEKVATSEEQKKTLFSRTAA